MLEKYIRIYQKKRNKKWAWKKIQKINKRERVHERILKASFKQWVVKREDNNEVKNIGVDVVTNFIKDNVESFSDAKFCMMILMMMNLKKIGFLDLNKARADSSKI